VGTGGADPPPLGLYAFGRGAADAEDDEGEEDEDVPELLLGGALGAGGVMCGIGTESPSPLDGRPGADPSNDPFDVVTWDWPGVVRHRMLRTTGVAILNVLRMGYVLSTGKDVEPETKSCPTLARLSNRIFRETPERITTYQL
jgi:hypothetical protein